jgi:predicted regulator of Ras-like GTPase activity (Roadblock/LC7/MglB family)
MTRERAVLDGVTRVPGVRSALAVSADDGLVVAESSVEGQNTESVAALAAALSRRLSSLSSAAGHAPHTLILLQATRGQLFVSSGVNGLVFVAVADTEVNIGAVRLALLDAVGRLA